MIDEKDMETDIKELARAHAKAAIDAMVEIMTNADAPASVRLSAAKSLLDRASGKVTTEKPKPESREEQVVRIERVIIDPKEPIPERYRAYTHAPNGQLPDEEEEDFDQQELDRVQRAPPDVGDDYKMTGCNEWG